MINITNHETKYHPLGQAALFTMCMILLAAAILFIAYTSGAKLTSPSRSASGEGAYPLVIIDAGHGGEDGGAVGVNGILEKDLNLEISFTLCDMLRANSVPVLMTRSEDILLYDRSQDYRGRKKVLDLQKRLSISNDNPGALFISVHMNTFPVGKYSGLQVYYSKNNGQSAVLAKTIQSTVRSLLQPDNNREIKPAGSGIYLLHNNKNPAVLIECGFISNEAECGLLSTPEYRRKLALVMFNAIMEHIDGQNTSAP